MRLRTFSWQILLLAVVCLSRWTGTALAKPGQDPTQRVLSQIITQILGMPVSVPVVRVEEGVYEVSLKWSDEEKGARIFTSAEPGAINCNGVCLNIPLAMLREKPHLVYQKLQEDWLNIDNTLKVFASIRRLNEFASHHGLLPDGDESSSDSREMIHDFWELYGYNPGTWTQWLTNANQQIAWRLVSRHRVAIQYGGQYVREKSDQLPNLESSSKEERALARWIERSAKYLHRIWGIDLAGQLNHMLNPEKLIEDLLEEELGVSVPLKIIEPGIYQVPLEWDGNRSLTIYLDQALPKDSRVGTAVQISSVVLLFNPMAFRARLRKTWLQDAEVITFMEKLRELNSFLAVNKILRWSIEKESEAQRIDFVNQLRRSNLQTWLNWISPQSRDMCLEFASRMAKTTAERIWTAEDFIVRHNGRRPTPKGLLPGEVSIGRWLNHYIYRHPETWEADLGPIIAKAVRDKAQVGPKERALFNFGVRFEQYVKGHKGLLSESPDQPEERRMVANFKLIIRRHPNDWRRFFGPNAIQLWDSTVKAKENRMAKRIQDLDDFILKHRRFPRATNPSGVSGEAALTQWLKRLQKRHPTDWVEHLGPRAQQMISNFERPRVCENVL